MPIRILFDGCLTKCSQWSHLRTSLKSMFCLFLRWNVFNRQIFLFFHVFVFYSLAFSITLIFPIDKFCSIFLNWLFQISRSCLPDPCQLLFVLQTIIQTTIFCLFSFLFVLFFRSKWLCDQICQQKVIKRTLLSVWIQFRYLRKKFYVRPFLVSFTFQIFGRKNYYPRLSITPPIYHESPPNLHFLLQNQNNNKWNKFSVM